MSSPYLHPQEIVHLLPGRMRVQVPSLKQNTSYAQILVTELLKKTGIQCADANIYTGKALIHFDHEKISSNQILTYIDSLPNENCQSLPNPRGIDKHQTQWSTIAAGGLLLAVSSKRFLFGTSSLARLHPLGLASGILTVISGYPILRQLLDKHIPRGSKRESLLLGTATLGSLVFRESLLGLGAMSLIGVTTLWNHSKAVHHRKLTVDYTVAPDLNPPSMISIADKATENYFPTGVNYQPLLPLTLIVAGIGLMISGWSHALAILVTGCPCAYSLARHVPNGLGVGRSAEQGILIKHEEIYHQLSMCDYVVFTQSVSVALGYTIEDYGFHVVQSTQADLKTTITQLQTNHHRVVLIGDSDSDVETLYQADLVILLGSDDVSMVFADAYIPSGDERVLEILFHITHTVHTTQHTSRYLIHAGQIVGMALAANGRIGLFTALNVHHLINLVVLLNSIIQSPISRITHQQLKAKKLKTKKLKPMIQNYQGNSNKLKKVAGMRSPGVIRDHHFDIKGTNRLQGLSRSDVLERLASFGPNRLPDPEKISLLYRISSQCKGTMALVMLGSTGVSLLAGGIWDTVALGGLLFVNALVGAIQSDKADNAVGMLHQMNPGTTQVLRDGDLSKISSEQLVPGDIIYLVPGDSIPADGVLISPQQCVVDESLLTGESVGVSKSILKQEQPELAAGTSIIKGDAQMLVVRTGLETRMGQIALMLRSDQRGPTPLQLNMNNLGGSILKGLVLVCGAVFGIGVLRGHSVQQMALTSTSIAAATVPQGMTTFVTLGLVAGVRELAKRKTLVRKLAALETMACVNCICLDKTGTITENQMTVQKVFTGRTYTVTGNGTSRQGQLLYNQQPVHIKEDYRLWRLLHTAVICNDAQVQSHSNQTLEILGDGTEGALLVMAEKAGLNTTNLQQHYECIHQTEFSSERERMSVLAQDHNHYILSVKGSPESVLDLCSLPWDIRAKLGKTSQELAGQGLRVLAFAEREIKSYYGQSMSQLEHNLSFLGFVGMMDPPRKNVAQVITRCQEAGIHVVMLTGDHPETAIAISKQVGLNASIRSTITGKELSTLNKKNMREMLDQITVFSRVQPDQKRDVVNALKQAGFIVAMVGDGVNDGPALRAADVGISMGSKSTDVAQEASDIILATDDLEQIITGIEQGRTAYDNISKVISYLLTSNAGEISLMLSATASGMSMPLLPIQLLWVNLLGDGPPALALCVEQSDGRALSRPPHRRDSTLLGETIKRRIVLRGLRMGLTTLALYGFSLWQGVPLDTARTRTLAALGIEQIFHLFESRIVEPGVPVPHNPTMSKTTLLSSAMLVSSVYFPPLQRIFGLVPLQAVEWLLVLGFAFFASPPLVPRVRSQPTNMPKLHLDPANSTV